MTAAVISINRVRCVLAFLERLGVSVQPWQRRLLIERLAVLRPSSRIERQPRRALRGLSVATVHIDELQEHIK